MSAVRWSRTLRVGVALLVAAPLLAQAPARGQSAGTVFVRTFPALSGVSLKIGSAFVTTGPDGSAATQVADLNGIAKHVTLARSTLGRRTLLDIRKIVTAPHSAPRQSHLTVALDVTSLVQVHIRSGRTGVPATSVRAVRLHSVTGSRITFRPAKTATVALLARRPRLVAGRLRLQSVTWSVDRIVAGPGVALTSAHPRFDPYGQRNWALELTPVNGVVRIATVPATPDVTFLLEGASITTGRDGTVEAPVADLNDVAARLALDSHDAGTRSVSLVDVVRQKPTAPRQRRVLVALAVRRPVDLRFVDHSGRSIDSRRITEVQLEDSSGETLLTTAQLSEPVMLQASAATQVHKVWQARAVSYAIASVRMDGGNAVFAGRQRIAPERSGRWVVTLSVFTLTVRVHDALFGARVGSQVLIQRPDGTTYAVRVGGGTATRVPSMVRGLYDVKVDAAVFGAHTKVLVSRDDVVDLRVVTWPDALAIGLAGLIVLASLVWGGIVLGRRRTAAAAEEVE